MAIWSGRLKGSAEFIRQMALHAPRVDGTTDQSIRVALQNEAGLRSEVGRPSKAGGATAIFRLLLRWESVPLLVRPKDASKEELTGPQTIRVGACSQQLRLEWMGVEGASGPRRLGLIGASTPGPKGGCNG